MLEFLPSSTLVKKFFLLNRWLNVALALIFAATTIFLVLETDPLSAPNLQKLSFVGLVSFVVGLTLWLIKFLSAKRLERLKQLRLCLNENGLNCSSGEGVSAFAFKEIQKMIIERTESGEVRSLELRLVDKKLNLTGLERVHEIFLYILERVPQVPVANKYLEATYPKYLVILMRAMFVFSISFSIATIKFFGLEPPLNTVGFSSILLLLAFEEYRNKPLQKWTKKQRFLRESRVLRYLVTIGIYVGIIIFSIFIFF